MAEFGPDSKRFGRLLFVAVRDILALKQVLAVYLEETDAAAISRSRSGRRRRMRDARVGGQEASAVISVCAAAK